MAEKAITEIDLHSVGVRLGMDSHVTNHTEDEIYKHVLLLEQEARVCGFKKGYSKAVVALSEAEERAYAAEKLADKAEAALRLHLNIIACHTERK